MSCMTHICMNDLCGQVDFENVFSKLCPACGSEMNSFFDESDDSEAESHTEGEL